MWGQRLHLKLDWRAPMDEAIPAVAAPPPSSAWALAAAPPAPVSVSVPAPSPSQPSLIPGPEGLDGRSSRLYLNRELSWLEFNARVLAEAESESVPLLERLKFHAIVASNLDEFFMVRVAGLKQQLTGEVDEMGPDQLTVGEQLNACLLYTSRSSVRASSSP